VNKVAISGSPAARSACPKNEQHSFFRHSKTARVITRPPTRVNQSRCDEGITYGRDIGPAGSAFHGVPLLASPARTVATHSRTSKHPDAHRKPFLDFSSDCRSVSIWLTNPTGLIRPFFSVRAPRIFLISNPHQTPDFLRDFDFFDFHFKPKTQTQKVLQPLTNNKL
jgi:hypothetical protein